MKRGWKVISGTGHQRFLAELPSGYDDTMRYLTPFELSEFILLLDSGISNNNMNSVFCVNVSSCLLPGYVLN